MALSIPMLFSTVIAQELNITQLPAEGNKVVIVPVFTERESDVGSPYLSVKWVKGTVELADHRRIPEKDQTLFFNYDKLNQVVYVVNQSGKERAYPIDSISGFELVINNQLVSFEKIPWISNNYYLMPVYRSEKGYSLYKRLFTKWERSSYQNAGYYSTGKKYDEYKDYYEYYLIYPGKTSFRKLYLKERSLRRLLGDESVLVGQYFNLYENEINEQSLIGLLQFVNDRKYPE